MVLLVPFPNWVVIFDRGDPKAPVVPSALFVDSSKPPPVDGFWTASKLNLKIGNKSRIRIVTQRACTGGVFPFFLFDPCWKGCHTLFFV